MPEKKHEAQLARIVEERRQRMADAVNGREFFGPWVAGLIILSEIYLGCCITAKEVYNELYRVGNVSVPEGIEPTLWQANEINRIPHELFAKIPLEFSPPQGQQIIQGPPPPPFVQGHPFC